MSGVPSPFILRLRSNKAYANDNWGWGLDDEELGLRMVECGLRVEACSRQLLRPRPDQFAQRVHSDERGYHAEWWNLDMENGKCSPAGCR